jgi:acyl-CoA synthetase (AMP-forming)/AMP-acid ligase II/acyl carrier protein
LWSRRVHLKPSLLEPKTIADAIARHAARGPNRPAIIGTEFAQFSYRGLDVFIKQIGKQLRAAGIGRRSRVGIMLPRGPEGALVVIAVASHAISVPLNPNRPEAEIEEELARVHLDALVLPGWVDLPASVIAQRSSFGLIEASRADGSLANVTLRHIRKIPALAQRSANATADSIALIFTTSGTTGTPKLIPVTHENLLVTAAKMRQWFNLSPDDRTAFVLPGYYGAAIKISLLAPLLLGGSVGLPATRHVEDLAEWVPELCPTWLWANPTFFQAVLDKLRSGAGSDFRHALRFVVSGTAYLPPKLRTELEATLSVPVLQSYGMSEAGLLAADPAPPGKRKPGTAGLISRDELSIVGPDGAPVPDGESGEIVVYGRTVSPDIDETEDHRPTKRRLFTGDLGFIDSEGYLTIVGRTKELINRGGEKISPYEVERALLLHPSVQEAAAYSVPHPRLGENVSAAVVLKSGTAATTQEIKTFLSNHLSAFKIPQNVFVVGDLPKGPTGKISRSELSTAMAHCAHNIAHPESPLEFQILEIWQTLLRRDDIGIDDDFFELGGDSLLALQMVLEIEAIARRGIPPSCLKTIYTIRQLAAMIIRTDEASDQLVTCAKDGHGTPFFFCHGDFATRGLWALKLVDMLTCTQPVFLLSVCSEPNPTFSLVEAAKSYLPHLLAAQPSGPFRLGGFCNGGLLVWEIAHQLERLGRSVEFVVVINARSLNASLAIRMIARITRLIGAVAPRTVSEKFKRDAMRAVWIRFGQKIYYGPYLRAMSNYLPPKLRSEVIVVLCDEDRMVKGFSSTNWNRLAPKVHSRYVAGTHLSAITTHVGELARVLDGFLSGAHSNLVIETMKRHGAYALDPE